jgi:hypothetical protein
VLWKLGESHVVTINDHVLSPVGFFNPTTVVWDGWLVYRPVVEWWIDDWILDLCELDSLLSILIFLEDDLICANDHFHVELDISHGVRHDSWINQDWNSDTLLLSVVVWCWTSWVGRCVHSDSGSNWDVNSNS